jgi:hypothetical protein
MLPASLADSTSSYSDLTPDAAGAGGVDGPGAAAGGGGGVCSSGRRRGEGPLVG